MQTYKPIGGEDISTTAERMVAMAQTTGKSVTALFNDIPLAAQPTDSPDTVVAYYNAQSTRRHEAYLASPEYAERKRKDEERRARITRERAVALANAPAVMTLRNAPAWRDAVDKNQDPYGGAVIQFAATWARIMEGMIGQGQSIDQCADKACELADNGITGFMYGCAVSILATVWVHGEALRRWHNLDTQIRDEGARANADGGVLNPAVLRIG